DLGMRAGKQLPDSPILWPEACGYSAKVTPPASRLEGRSILLLGSVAQWKNGVPASTRLPVQMPAGQTNFVLMQGRKNEISAFEPFPERIRREIPFGLSVAETKMHRAQQEARAQKIARANNLVLDWAALLLLGSVLVRLFLLWDRERRRKKSLREESSATGRA